MGKETLKRSDGIPGDVWADAGVLIADRYSAYAAVPDGRRQFCWAHLLRAPL